MTIRKSPEQLKDFALYGFKAMQDIALKALDERDTATFDALLKEIGSSFKQFLERPIRDSLVGIQYQLEHAADDAERQTLQKRLSDLTKTKDVASAIELSKGQLFFGLAARTLELLSRETDDIDSLQQLFRIVSEYLPTNLKRLTEVFGSVSERAVTEFWGWDWLDFVADGEAHGIDSYSRSNRLYGVQALKIFYGLTDLALAPTAFRLSEDLISLFEENNTQGVMAMLRSFQQHPEFLPTVLTQEDRSKVPALIEALLSARVAAEKLREMRLAASPVSSTKLEEFKKIVAEAYKESERLRPVARALGAYSDLTKSLPGSTPVLSWGYNQLDEKAAFVDDWHVSYSGWGESYGRGIGQAANRRSFEEMVKGALKGGTIGKGNLIPTIEAQLKTHRFKNAVVLQSLRSIEYDEIRRRELFIPAYHPDCPKTQLNGTEGFIGVLRVADQHVPVIDVYIHEQSLRNKVVVADLASFISWEQFNPANTADEQQFVRDDLLIKVIDLNSDEPARKRLLADNPKWLQDKGTPDEQNEFLRTHVIVNVYNRMRVTIKDSNSAVCITVKRDKDLER